MNWLDSGANGPCNATEGDPALIEQNAPGTHVVFSNIKWGDIGSTFSSNSTKSSPYIPLYFHLAYVGHCRPLVTQ